MGGTRFGFVTFCLSSLPHPKGFFTLGLHPSSTGCPTALAHFHHSAPSLSVFHSWPKQRASWSYLRLSRHHAWQQSPSSVLGQWAGGGLGVEERLSFSWSVVPNSKYAEWNEGWVDLRAFRHLIKVLCPTSVGYSGLNPSSSSRVGREEQEPVPAPLNKAIGNGLSMGLGLWFARLGHSTVAPAISTWLTGNWHQVQALSGLKAKPCVGHGAVGKWKEFSENSFSSYF